MADYQSKIAQLQRKAADIVREVGQLTTQRREFSYLAAEGDERARKKVADTDYLLDALRKEEMTVNDALECAAALARQAQTEAEQNAKRDKDIAASKVASAVCALNAELDQMMQQLREAFERRAALLHELGNTGLVDLTLINKLSGKGPATRAACHHGLHAHIAIETVAPGSRMRLADGNTQLLGIGKPPPDKPERVNLNKAAAS